MPIGIARNLPGLFRRNGGARVVVRRKFGDAAPYIVRVSICDSDPVTTHRWSPDFCPSSPSCSLLVTSIWAHVVSVLRYCTYHQALKDSGRTDNQVFEAIYESCRLKELTRTAAAAILGSPPDYTVDANAVITLVTGATGQTLIDTIAAVGAAAVAVPAPIGALSVTVVT